MSIGLFCRISLIRLRCLNTMPLDAKQRHPCLSTFWSRPHLFSSHKSVFSACSDSPYHTCIHLIVTYAHIHTLSVHLTSSLLLSAVICRPGDSSIFAPSTVLADSFVAFCARRNIAFPWTQRHKYSRFHDILEAVEPRVADVHNEKRTYRGASMTKSFRDGIDLKAGRAPQGEESDISEQSPQSANQHEEKEKEPSMEVDDESGEGKGDSEKSGEKEEKNVSEKGEADTVVSTIASGTVVVKDREEEERKKEGEEEVEKEGEGDDDDDDEQVKRRSRKERLREKEAQKVAWIFEKEAQKRQEEEQERERDREKLRRKRQEDAERASRSRSKSVDVRSKQAEKAERADKDKETEKEKEKKEAEMEVDAQPAAEQKEKEKEKEKATRSSKSPRRASPRKSNGNGSEQEKAKEKQQEKPAEKTATPANKTQQQQQQAASDKGNGKGNANTTASTTSSSSATSSSASSPSSSSSTAASSSSSNPAVQPPRTQELVDALQAAAEADVLFREIQPVWRLPEKEGELSQNIREMVGAKRVLKNASELTEQFLALPASALAEVEQGLVTEAPDILRELEKSVKEVDAELGMMTTYADELARKSAK